MPQRQEVLNVILAQLLQERGLVAAPEQIIRGSSHQSMPDVIVDFRGLRVQLECEFAGRNSDEARRKAFVKALKRVEDAIAQVGIAVVYPAKLKDISFDRAKRELAASQLEYAIVTEAIIVQPGEQLHLFRVRPEPSFLQGRVDDLGDALRRCYDQLVRDETLNRAVDLIEQRIDEFVRALGIQVATAVRMARVLGVEDLPIDAKVLRPRQRVAVEKIAALIIVNALIFQEVLSQTNARVSSLQSFGNPPNLVAAMRGQWQFILDQINYYPIFFTAERLLECLSASPELDRSLRALLHTALSIVSWRASLRHDLAGRIYHRLLDEAKYLGAYYTSIPSATLLLKVALRPDAWDINWSSVPDLKRLQIGDFACGTGTLLMAAADSVLDNHVRVCAAQGKEPKSSEVNQILGEHVLSGYDVLPSAVHLTASTLTLRVPESPMDQMHLFRVLHGGDHGYLGTLDALDPGGARGTLFSQPERIGAHGAERVVHLDLPVLDLCVMNPPFTSSRKGNRLFGSVPDAQRRRMQDRLGRLVAQESLSASITAGLGAVFVALGDRQLKEGGRLALVLPKAVLSGIAWSLTRELFSQKYHLEYVFVSHEVHHWNFSENTNLTEALVVARKLRSGEDANGSIVTFVNLWRQPSTVVGALSLAHTLLSSRPPLLGDGTGVMQLRIDEAKYGEAFALPWSQVKAHSLATPCAFAQATLTAVFMDLALHSRLQLPAETHTYRIPLCPLRKLGMIGPDPRDVYDGFSLAEGERTTYPALWGHNPDQVTSLRAEPNMYLRPRAEALEGRPLRDYTLLWPRAGRLLVAQRIRLNTKRVVAVRIDQKVLSDVWWPIDLKDSVQHQSEVEKCLVLWLNSSLGLFLLLGLREETEGAWVQYKKPMWEEMPVLDATALGQTAREKLVTAYNRLHTRVADYLYTQTLQANVYV
jgi:hypothetical protein